MAVSKRYIRFAWRIAIDTSVGLAFPLISLIAILTFHSSRFRTLAPLQQPPHVIALASLYITSLLLFGPVEAEKIRADNQIGEIDQTHVELLEETFKGRNTIEQDTSWETDLRATLGDMDGERDQSRTCALCWSLSRLIRILSLEVVHAVLDMYIVVLSSLAVDTTGTPLASPHSPSDPSTNMNSTAHTQTQNRYLAPSFALPSYWTSSTLTNLKIQLHQSRAEGIGGRQKVDMHTPIEATFGNGIGDDSAAEGSQGAWLSLVEGLGKNEGTVRFVFG
jgi:hypothetical protein